MRAVIVLERDVHGVSPHFTIATNRRVESRVVWPQSNAQRVLDFPPLARIREPFGSARSFRQAQSDNAD
jgi:hypothetical protein